MSNSRAWNATADGEDRGYRLPNTRTCAGWILFNFLFVSALVFLYVSATDARGKYPEFLAKHSAVRAEAQETWEDSCGNARTRHNTRLMAVCSKADADRKLDVRAAAYRDTVNHILSNFNLFNRLPADTRGYLAFFLQNFLFAAINSLSTLLYVGIAALLCYAWVNWRVVQSARPPVDPDARFYSSCGGMGGVPITVIDSIVERAIQHHSGAVTETPQTEGLAHRRGFTLGEGR